MKKYLLNLLLLILTFHAGYSNIFAEDTTHLNNQSTEDFFKEGSGERWNHIINNIDRIKVGMTKKDVISILGIADTNKFVPKNTLQYSVFYEYRPDGENGKYIQIRIDDNDKVIKVERTDYIYGPPPG